MTDFASLNLAAPIAAALAQEGYVTPTPIQAQAIPHVMEGRDLLGIAQTGTGKTAAFALPILHRLALNPAPTPRHSARVLVLAPTRELASQIAESFRTYGAQLRLHVGTVFGGVPINRQIRQMERGADVLVATPGRLIDLIEQRAITLSKVEVLVLDEADQMLDLGFIHALKRIVPLLPAERQTLFFSATMPTAIAELASRYLTDPAKVAITPAATTAERVAQSVTFVNQAEKQALLTLVLGDPEIDRALVFTRTKHGADRVVRHLEAMDIRSVAIHGNKSQVQRERALELFRSGRCRVLVATDIAARGIDIDGVSHVVNFEVPNVPEQYVHRIGRTARAGADGRAISFVADDERSYLRDIERLTRIKIAVEPLPENFLAAVAQVKAVKPKPQPEPRAERSFGDGPRGRRPQGERSFGDRPRGDRPQGERGFGDRPRGDRPQGERSFGDRPRGDRPQGERSFGDRPRGDRPQGERSFGDRPRGDRPQGERSFGDRPRGDRPQGERSFGDRPRGDRPQGERSFGDRPRGDRPQGERSFGDRPRGDRPQGERSFGDRPRGDRPQGERSFGDRPRGDRPQGERSYGDRPFRKSAPHRAGGAPRPAHRGPAGSRGDR
ncbi:DEAD/DEAH box helicase [Hankyongella ginsenosidimutans]|uniref:DEAD-box ATP-dependent RNA helicase RhpA n=1 Tax=Hankyongella ginsenosidimutans TaxID=1763828 RepID=A0A4D7CA22_9SPHN|nr:DEAD/DEAH box helicase [Hankyongella ginsenosidimutans]QCI80003.1 DEAD/DEAH box helicase [Hankyongella ginsenosidimutans]